MKPTQPIPLLARGQVRQQLARSAPKGRRQGHHGHKQIASGEKYETDAIQRSHGSAAARISETQMKTMVLESRGTKLTLNLVGTQVGTQLQDVVHICSASDCAASSHSVTRRAYLWWYCGVKKRSRWTAVLEQR